CTVPQSSLAGRSQDHRNAERPAVQGSSLLSPNWMPVHETIITVDVARLVCDSHFQVGCQVCSRDAGYISPVLLYLSRDSSSRALSISSSSLLPTRSPTAMSSDESGVSVILSAR